MPNQLDSRSKNWQFSHAAAAMGAYWERARKSEARGIRRARPIYAEGIRPVLDAASQASVVSTSLRRSG